VADRRPQWSLNALESMCPRYAANGTSQQIRGVPWLKASQLFFAARTNNPLGT